MEDDLILFQDYRIAMQELIQLGTIITSLVTVQKRTFIRVTITINDEVFSADNQDQMLAIIQLRNQI